MLIVVLTNSPANNHAGLEGLAGEHCIENLTANVIEMDIDTLRVFTLEAGNHIFVLVVDRTVEAEFIDQCFALFRTTAIPTT